ncbi:hypothetical protein P152DRAFT_197927 [Eremomyces bilateralis CBS 781.70]|uniref:DNA polymerase delta subunit 2 n=1 Tax=Eremomyces bilateralis CBS 781.70 TaxID=1392243 RepID=A0A6G1GCL5_9PEZI|nr:uncharacterized protein P152DRAFT_197927 [Eremomyces bilateralis CBS 781.70]KAF1815835.1 hypothetical protein P152DRAFT_197927 [Eremomyces bilateralis CBS 781.70]
MEMPLKPNVLDDISKEHWIAAPPLRHKYIKDDDGTRVMVEDESGRLRLTGSWLQSELLVTGCIVAALGTENADGEFEVLDTRIADLPRQPQRWERDDIDEGKIKKNRPNCGKIAVVSGLGIGDDSLSQLRLDLLTEYLLGESLGDEEQTEATKISRLIIAGDTLANSSTIPSREQVAIRKTTSKTYGYDATAYNAAPTENLDSFLSTLLPSLPITVLPGASDPVNVSLPQQPLHPALYPKGRAYSKLPIDKDPQAGWLDAVTNPWEGDIDGWRFLGNGGQPIDDIYKYVSTEDRVQMMEHILRWRVNVPTAPDTLCKFSGWFQLPFQL